MSSTRRNPLDKEKFLEGNRQKWVAIGIVLGITTMIFTKDPSPFLQYFGLIIGAGVLGWSVDSAVKAYRVNSDSSSRYEDKTETLKNNVELIARPAKDYES